ncbi:hypothetical protein KVR01_013792 [Diaporthe batatas]|uniref:uncharacterized protein n=1 Tax=Diaporthe batatas TaxID=748121 RepID=UPI001D04D1C3|nr:uncharacterized protein KVR01_013792 [Diaporthe batatas]KAG8156340.1 hypothetical protein KVR01_013792 [Diaporthe batatas]
MSSASIGKYMLQLVDITRCASIGQIAGLLLVTLCITSALHGSKKKNIDKVPVHNTSRLWPAMVSQLKFVTGARSIISSGYQKFKGSPFIVRRFDTDYNILPMQYLEEVRLISPSILSGRIATSQNMLYKWTDLHFLNRSDLHVQVMKRKLAPELSKFLKIASQELDYGWDLDVPQPEDWAEVDVQQISRLLVARMSARIFLGLPACRDPEWIKVSLDYTMDAFTTAFVLRMFPTWVRPIVAAVLPSRIRLKQYRNKAEEVMAARMRKHVDSRREQDHCELVEDEADETLVDWMLDNGTQEETTLAEMANRQCVMTLASIHTTSTNTATFLFELCEHPEWFPVILEEIEQVKEQMGDHEIDYRRWHTKLEKMDSFLLECFRLHPPILLNPQRVALSAYTLKDGTQIPKGARIAFTSSEHQMDPMVTPDPLTFDPMRSYRKRYSSVDQLDRHQAVITDMDSNLTFGYGNQACPGRFLGVAEIKMLLARLLTEFEFKYPEGKSMPRTMSADENVFLDPSARLMMRKRKVPNVQDFASS